VKKEGRVVRGFMKGKTNSFRKEQRK